MEVSSTDIIRKIIQFLFIITLISNLILRRSILSFVYLLILPLFPFIKSKKGWISIYGLSFAVSFILSACQIALNITFVYRFKKELQYSSSSDGCHSDYDSYIFKRLGFIWFSCDLIGSVMIKLASDVFTISISLIGLIFNILRPIPPQTSNTLQTIYTDNQKYILVLLDFTISLCISILPFISYNITTIVYLYAMLIHPIIYSFYKLESSQTHTNFSYFLTKKFVIIIFYLTSNIYLMLLYLSQFPVLTDRLEGEGMIQKFISNTLFAHLSDVQKGGLPVFVLVLQLILVFSSYFTLAIRYEEIPSTSSLEFKFESSSRFLHLRLLFQKYCYALSIILCFVWVVVFNNYASFVILLITVCPCSCSFKSKLKFFQLLCLSLITFTSIMSQFIFTVTSSTEYYISSNHSIYSAIGIYSTGYAPKILILKYFIYLIVIFAFIPLIKRKNRYSLPYSQDIINLNTCMICDDIKSEGWLTSPNDFIIILTYLITVFSRPLICVVPLIELRSGNTSVHVCVLICIFILISVTQTKKNGWEGIQKFGLVITNAYIILWTVACYFFQNFSNLIPGINLPVVKVILELFDLSDQSSSFIISSYGWMFTCLLVNRFLLSYYSSAISSNQFIATTSEQPFVFPQVNGVSELYRAIVKIFWVAIVKSIKKLVMNRRLIIAIACFGVSLVQPSLLTFAPFFFSCIFATTHHRKFNQVVSTILMSISVIIVIIMTVYQNKHIPVVTLNPYFQGISSNISLIVTGLDRSHEAARPIIAFLCVIFMFSFFNSLSRYYTVEEPSEHVHVTLDSIKSYSTHMILHFLTYYGYQFVIISGFVSSVSHSDIGSIIGLTFISFLLFFCSDLCVIPPDNRKYFIFVLDFYKYFLVLLIMTRFMLHFSFDFMNLYIKQFITNENTFNIIHDLFIQRTLHPNNRYNLIYDYIHLFLLRVYTRDLMKKKLQKLNECVFVPDFTSCRNLFQTLHHGVYYHFIRFLFAIAFIVPFQNICFVNTVYMIICGIIIVFQNKMYYSKDFKRFIKISAFFPVIVTLVKLIFQLTTCLHSSLLSTEPVVIQMMFRSRCENPNLLSLNTSFCDILILFVILIQLKIFHSKEFTYTIINHYLYHLEAYNISAIATRESEASRLQYVQQLREKRNKIKKSIEAIKHNISEDCGIPLAKNKLFGMYGVTKKVFDKFYSHRDGQNKIFDDYNSKDVDDFIEDSSLTSTRVHSPVPLVRELTTDAIQQSRWDKVKAYLGWMNILFVGFEKFKKKVKKMYHKEEKRQADILNIINRARTIHFNELNNFTKCFNLEFEYKLEELHSSNDAVVQIDSPSSFMQYLLFMKILIGTMMHYLTRHTDFLVFIAIVINQIYSSSLISMIVTISYFAYPAIAVPNPSPMYWRIVSLFVLFSSFSRYITSIPPLNNIFICDMSGSRMPTRHISHGVLCVYNIFALDGTNYSLIPDLLLLLTIQIHLVSLHYRGMLCTSLKLTDSSNQQNNIFTRIRAFITRFVKKYEKNECTMEHDYYSVIFLCQAGQWIIIAFYWNSFLGSSQLFGDITQIIKGSVIPISFSILISLQSLFLLIDRFININRKRFYKLVYTLIIVIAVHLFTFFIVPYKTQSPVTKSISVCLFYVLYCLYFYFSFIPVRNGYSSKHLLPYHITRFHNYYSIVILYIIIYFPFIYEVDTILRWFSSLTTLSVFQFLKIDEIFFNMHICKSFRKIMANYNEPNGAPYYFPSKLFLTLLSLGIFFLAMILPLWIYSTGVSASKSVLPAQIDISISINGYSPLYESSVVRKQFIHYNTYKKISDLAEKIDPNNKYHTKSIFFDYFEIGDIIALEFPKPSFLSWQISYPSRIMLIDDIKNTLVNMTFRIRFKIHRESSDLLNVFGSEKVEGSFLTQFNITNESDVDFQKNQFIETLSELDKPMLLKYFINTGIRVEPSKPIQYFKTISHYQVKDICALRNRIVDTLTNVSSEWWEFEALETSDSSPEACNRENKKPKKSQIRLLFFIDFLKSSYIDFLGPSKNAIALYIILITSVSTFLKKFFLNTSHLIMYHEVPNPDYILNLCRYIYRARWSADLELEEFFISILFYIYRSPETLIQVTKLPNQPQPNEPARH